MLYPIIITFVSCLLEEKKFWKMEEMALLIYFIKYCDETLYTLDDEHLSTCCCNPKLHLALDNVVHCIRNSTEHLLSAYYRF